MMLCLPAMCYEYSDESWSINVESNHRETLSWIGFDNKKLAEFSHPIALELSVNDSIFWGVSINDSVSLKVIAAAINSSKLIDNFPIMSSGRLYFQAIPAVLYPPMPCSQASEYVVTVGIVNVIFFISIPFLLTVFRILIHRWRSSRQAQFGC